MSKQIINLSSTAFSKSACVLNLHRTVVDGYKEIPSSKIVYGVAVHKFIDTMFKTGEIGNAIMAMKKAFSIPKESSTKQAHLDDERHLLNTCQSVWFNYIEDDSTFEIIEIDDKPLTEQTFKIPYFENDYCLINLCGTLDKIGQFKGGCFAIGDWKTTSFWDTTSMYGIRRYFDKYKLSKQLRLYSLACKLMHEREPDSVLGKIGGTKMGTFIDAIFLKPNANDNLVKRSEIFQYTNEELDAFRLTIDDYCIKLSSHIKTGYLPKEGILNGACDNFCSFRNVCAAPDNVAKLILERDFKKVPFEPLNYNEVE